MNWPSPIRFRRNGGSRSLATVLALGLASTGALAGGLLVDEGIAHAATSGTTPAATAASGTTWYVRATAKTAPTCATASSAHAFPTIADALSCAQSGDTVKVGAGTFAGQFTLSANVTLKGLGANQTVIENAPPTTTVTPEVTVAPNVSATVADLTVNGEGTEAYGLGGNPGISDDGASLILDGVVITDTSNDIADSTTTTAGAAVTVVPPTGTAGALTVLDSTISDNFGTDAGGILVGGSSSAPSSLQVVNSTISGNEGINFAGGIFLDGAGSTLRDDTVAGNTGDVVGGLDFGPSTTETVTDTIDATNTSIDGASLDDCHVSPTTTLTDGGHNLVGVVGGTDDCAFVNGVNGDLAGTATSPLDPDLGALADNGGPTPTQALLSGSPAIAAGNAADCEAAPVNDRDQRGDPRNATTRLTCDIGAYDTGGLAS
jgi:hypothetical protein